MKAATLQNIKLKLNKLYKKIPKIASFKNLKKSVTLFKIRKKKKKNHDNINKN